MADLTQEQWSEQLNNDDNAVIIDVRTDAEFEEGYIPGAVQIDIFNGAEFLRRAKELDPEKNYYVYCRSGGRSGQFSEAPGAPWGGTRCPQRRSRRSRSRIRARRTPKTLPAYRRVEIR